MQRYAECSPSQAKWLGTLPSHWDCKKIGSLFAERKVKVSDKNYEPLSVTKMGILPQLEDAAKSNDGDNRKLVRAGDFVINSRSDRKGSCGVSELDGSVSLINLTLIPRGQWNRRYVHYLLRSQPFSEEYYRNGRGIVADLWTTKYSEMKSILLPVPPRSEQDQIVRFLDWKVSSINKLINIKQKEIGALEEQREALISQATHCGILKPSKLKESGFAWMGDIPVHWHIRRFSKVAVVRTNLVSPQEHFEDIQISPASIEKGSGRIVYTQTVQEAGIVSNNHRFYRGQIIYSKVRPLLNKVAIAPFDGLCSADMYPIETILETRYLKYFMLSQNFLCQLLMTGNRVKMPKINQDELASVFITFPEDKKEQKEIADYLDEACERIQASIECIKLYIAMLRELSARLIADAVTGKIDVRGIEIPEFEFVDEDADEDRENSSEDKTSEDLDFDGEE